MAEIRQHPWFGGPVRLAWPHRCSMEDNIARWHLHPSASLSQPEYKPAGAVGQQKIQAAVAQEEPRAPRLPRAPSQDEDAIRSVLSHAVDSHQQPLDFRAV